MAYLRQFMLLYLVGSAALECCMEGHKRPAEDNRECFALPAGKGVQMVSGPI
jgi:hypothetical protein